MTEASLSKTVVTRHGQGRVALHHDGRIYLGVLEPDRLADRLAGVLLSPEEANEVSELLRLQSLRRRLIGALTEVQPDERPDPSGLFRAGINRIEQKISRLGRGA